ncbi:hypothetical protein [uncultured Polaribacter sp.]|uniref:hypothetical protein n=1 Tax=uncultured Polaribacter sp. TaxID=174711 RepID=UPI00343227F8
MEFLQLSNLQNYFPEKYAYYCKLVLATSFSFLDLLAYTFGIISIIFIENSLNN